jgi:hypothetical protein
VHFELLPQQLPLGQILACRLSVAIVDDNRAPLYISLNKLTANSFVLDASNAKHLQMSLGTPMRRASCGWEVSPNIGVYLTVRSEVQYYNTIL